MADDRFKSNQIYVNIKYKWPKQPIKRQKLSDWIKNQDLSICYAGETHFKYKEAGQLKG